MTTTVESLSENMLPVNQKDYQKLKIYINCQESSLYVYPQWLCNICAEPRLIEIIPML